MQLTMDKTILLKNLEQALGVVDRKTAMPILAHCLLEASEQGLVISATDLETNYRGVSGAEVREPGRCTVLAHSLHSLVKSLPPGEVELAGSDGKLTISTGASHYQLLTRNPDEFPPLPPVPEDGWVEIGAGVLVGLLQKVIFSMSTDDLQYTYNSIHWAKVERDGTFYLRLVSTDGHRLSLVEHPLPGLADLDFGEKGLLVPGRATREILLLARNQAKDGSIRLCPKTERDQLFIQSGNNTVGMRLLDSKYPDYEQIIPDKWKLTWAFPRKPLMEAIQRVSSLSSEKFRITTFRLGRDEVEITFDNPEVGTGREVVQATLKSGKPDKLPFVIGFNARYLLDPMAVMGGEMVEMDINAAETPVKLRDPAATEPSLWLLMPAVL